MLTKVYLYQPWETYIVIKKQQKLNLKHPGEQKLHSDCLVPVLSTQNNAVSLFEASIKVALLSQYQTGTILR